MNYFLLIIFLITITRGQCNNLFIVLYKLDDHLATGYKISYKIEKNY